MSDIRWMNNVRPKVRILLEDIAVSDVFVATAFDEEQSEICSAAAHMPDRAVAKCLHKLPSGKYEVDIEVMNPDAEQEDGDL